MIRQSHLHDDTLVRLIDDRDPGADAEHLEHCPRCQARLASLTRASQGLDDLLELTTPVEPVPEYDAAFLGRLATGNGPAAAHGSRGPARTRGWVLLLAASLAALLISVSPAGAWLARHLSPLFGRPPTPEARTTAPVAPSEPPAGGSEVSVNTSATVFVLHLSGDALPGDVHIRVSTVGRDPGLVSARLTPGGPDGSVLVEPDALRIRAAARDTLEVVVPEAVRQVRVFVDERLMADPTTEQLRDGGLWLKPSRGA